MTDQKHPITPPPELVEQWYEDGPGNGYGNGSGYGDGYGDGYGTCSPHRRRRAS